MKRAREWGTAAALLLALAAPGCVTIPELPPAEPEPEEPARPEPAPVREPESTAGQEIVVCGERVAIGTPVVLWNEPPGYNAYQRQPRFDPAGKVGARYKPGRSVRDPVLAREVQAGGWNRERLGRQVDLFVLHYDVCGTSEACHRVLHDKRGLSVHFMLDVDGTLYQTLDLRDQAWHARQANPRSIGVEIAHIGAYPPGQVGPLDAWYETSGAGGTRATRLVLPAGARLRTPDFVGAPVRPDRVRGTIQGATYEQYDFTPEQYEALAKLAAGLARILPELELDAPRDASGRVRDAVLLDEELDLYRGVLGHYHVSESKLDPGPAFQWERFLSQARALAGAP